MKDKLRNFGVVLCRLVWTSTVWRLWLERAEVPKEPRFVVRDSTLGNLERGEALLRADVGLIAHPNADDNLGLSDQTHSWLRDLAALNNDPARLQAVALISAWLAANKRWRPDTWSVDVLSERITIWLGLYDALFSSAPENFRIQLLTSLAQQARHVLGIGVGSLTGASRLRVLKAMVWIGISMPGCEKALFQALTSLRRQLACEINADGLYISRNPSEHADCLKQLTAIREGLRAASLQTPPELGTTITRMAAALRLLRHGDGCLALFNGAREERSSWIDSILSHVGGRTRSLRRLPESGYEKVIGGKSMLIVDVGSPAPAPWCARTHAGLLSFEFSQGRERIIVNSGAPPIADTKSPQYPAWRRAMAATAAHSTMTVADTNAIAIRDLGGISRATPVIAAQRYEKDGEAFIDAQHEGYVALFGLRHRRILSLSQDGFVLTAQDILHGRCSTQPSFALRWHLHPDVSAALSQDGRYVMLRTVSGKGWVLEIEDAPSSVILTLDQGIYCGTPGDPRRSVHICLKGVANNESNKISWRLARTKT